jgi:methyl-accepting chemotaxis protein
MDKINLELKEESQETKNQHLDAIKEQEIDFLIAEMFQKWLSAFEVQDEISSSVENKLTKLSEIMNRKTVDLTHKFQELYQNSQNQSSYMNELVQLASGISIQEKLIPIEDVAARVLDTFSASTNTLQELAERARVMIDRVSEATSALIDIETSIKSIEIINKKTKYLSLNAMIEAVKDQQGKEGAMAVANEVRELSNDTQLITNIIADQSHKMRITLDDARQTLEAIASFDFSETINAEYIIGKMIDGLVNNNKRMNSIMDVTTESTQEFAEIVGALIKSLQYEDRTQQDIQILIKELASVKIFFDTIPTQTEEILNKHFKDHIKKMGSTVSDHSPVPRTTELLTGEEDSGDVTLF